MRTLLILAAAARLFAQTPAPLTPDAAGVFPIWPGTPPGSESWTWREQMTGAAPNRMVRNVAIPTLTMYKPAGQGEWRVGDRRARRRVAIPDGGL